MSQVHLCGTLSLICLLASSAIAQPADKKPDAPVPTTPAATPTAPAVKADEKATQVYIQMTTSEGDIFLELDAEKAPITVANFLKYAENGHYNGTIFHRVISDFMIQGGGFDDKMAEKPTEPSIKNEWTNKLSHKRGTIAMARKGGSPAMVDSATSQFFINVSDNDGSTKYNLDRPQADGGGYAVFGKVISGMDVVDKIRMTKTGKVSRMSDVPVAPITITKVAKITKDEAEKAIKPAAKPAAKPTEKPADKPAAPTPSEPKK